MIKKNIVPVLSLIIVSILVYHRWLSFNIFTSGDSPFYTSNFIKSFIQPSVWFNSLNMGFINLVLWRLPTDLVNGLFGVFGFDTNVSEKFLYFWPTLVLANISAFVLVRKITKSNLSGFVGAVVFNYNTYYFVGITAFLIYAAAPWVIFSLLCFIKSLESRKLKFSVASALLLFVASSYDFRVAYIGVFLLFFYFLFHSFLIESISINSIKKNFILFFILLFIFILLNIFWVLPMLGLGSLTNNSVLSRTLFGNEFLNILYSLTFYHPFWTGIETAYFNPQQIMTYFWLIPIFAFLGLFLNKKNKYVLFFGFISLLGILLTKQVSTPFTGIYSWLFEHLPGFNAFREASKFYFLIALGYSVLIGSLIASITKNSESKKTSYLKHLLIALIIFVFLWNTFPIFTGSIQSLFVERHIPKDHIILNNFIVRQNKYFRTLWIPSNSTWSFYTDKNPMVPNISLLNDNLWKEFNVRNNFVDVDAGRFYIKYINEKHIGNLLNLDSVRYIIVPPEDKENHSDVFMYYGESRKYYINQLNKIKFLRKINIGAKDIMVYENYNYRPHIYITNNKEIISKEQEYKVINYKFVNPAEYAFSVKNVSNPFYLNFSESYHPQWNLRVGSFNWIDVLTKSNYFIDNKNHLKNDAGLNTFYINPTEVCKVESCKVNKDGSYDISGTLYFKPQSYMYLGLIISGATLAAVLSYILFILGRNLYERKNK